MSHGAAFWPPRWRTVIAVTALATTFVLDLLELNGAGRPGQSKMPITKWAGIKLRAPLAPGGVHLLALMRWRTIVVAVDGHAPDVKFLRL